MSTETPKTVSSSSWVWAKSTLIASVVMNAISLINIGRDLKITLIRWSEFFISAFEHVKTIVDFFVYPFSSFFALFSIEIPLITRNIYSIAFLTIYLISRAILQNVFDNRAKERKGKKMLLTNIVLILGMIVLSALLGFTIAGVEWLLSLIFINHLTPSIIVLLFLAFFIHGLITRAKNPKTIKIKFFFIEYVKLLSLFIIAITLLNYFTITFNE